MSVLQQRTIFLKDKDNYPDWDVVQEFTEPAIEFYCDRSKQPISKCEDTTCATLLGHVTKTRVGEVKKAVISKTETNIVP